MVDQIQHDDQVDEQYKYHFDIHHLKQHQLPVKIKEIFFKEIKQICFIYTQFTCNTEPAAIVAHSNVFG